MLFDQIASNKRRTWLLLIAFFGLLALTKAFAKIAVNINGVHRQPYAIFRKLKIVETDMMAIYQVMMQVIIPSQSNQRG